MTDDQIAQDVHAATDALNEAFRKARAAGLRVELETYSTDIIGAERATALSVAVFRRFPDNGDGKALERTK